MTERVYQLSRKMTRDEIIARLARSMMNRLRATEQSHRRSKAVLTENVNRAIAKSEFSFTAINREKISEAELITESCEILIERSEQTLSRSRSDRRIVTSSKTNVEMRETSSSRDQRSQHRRNISNQSQLSIIDQNSDESSVRAISKRASARLVVIVSRVAVAAKVRDQFENDASNENDISIDKENDVSSVVQTERCECNEFTDNLLLKLKSTKTISEIRAISLLERLDVFLSNRDTNAQLCFNHRKLMTSKLNLQTREKTKKKLLSMLQYFHVNRNRIDDVKVFETHHH